MNSQLRFALAIFLLGTTAIFLQARGSEPVVSRKQLTTFPRQLGTWSGTVIPIPDEDLRVLGSGDFLDEVYTNQKMQEPLIDLLILYFPTQRTGDTIHSPKHCLFGAGWRPVECGPMTVSLEGQAPFPVNRCVIEKGGKRQLVLYWYLSHGRAVANEYSAKFYLVADAIRLNRSDGALIRIMTSMPAGESVDTAQRRLLPFAATFVPLVDRYVPR